MNVVAFSSPHRPDWRWRIVDYAGATVEESSMGFATIALAVAEGALRLRHHVDRELSAPARPPASMSWRRRR
jgi:hypothetical protein